MPAAVTLNTAIGGETSNSYVDAATCSDYWTNHWNTTAAQNWLNLTAVQQVNLLMQACRVIETVKFVNEFIKQDVFDRVLYDRRTKLVLSVPSKRNVTRFYWFQRLQFPRNIDTYIETATIGDLFIPEPVIWAQCEQAVYLTTLDYTALQNRMQGVTLDKLTLGKGDVETTQEYDIGGTSLSPVAKEFLSPFMLRNARSRRA